MAGETALDKVLNALKLALQASEAFDGALIEIDRDDDDAYGNTEIEHGAINIIHNGTKFDHSPHGEFQNATLHTVDIDLDLITTNKAASTNAKRLRLMEAQAVAALSADRTLGGFAEDTIWTSSSGSEDVRTDVAARTLAIAILFATPLGDHFTVIGEPA